jgi:coiled-coil domain-containing protein 130
MPFAIWCSTCPKPTIIGQGVRFNAEKKKVGNYHTTPIFSFRMKHVSCGGWIEIRTDPKNTAYVVTEGAKKRDTGEDKHQDGEIRIRTDEERERLQNDAFAALEGRVEDKRQTLTDRSRIEELQRAKEKDWEDPYAASRRLRRAFRADRRVRQKNEGSTEALKDRMSLGMDLLAETEDDRRRAGFVDFGALDGETAIVKATSRPLFAGSNPPVGKEKAAKGLSDAELRREKLRQELSRNTMAAMDPFLSGEKPFAATVAAKRKRDTGVVAVEQNSGKESHAMALVDYESD